MAAMRLVVDLQARTLSITDDAGSAMLPLPPDLFALGTNISRFEHRPGEGLLLVDVGGERITVELGRAGLTLDELRAGRTLVYLDQGHWSTLSFVRHGSRALPEPVRRAAEELMAMVEAGEVLLPVSAGHLVETGPLHGEQRVQLAGTVLGLSLGWQMRHPLLLRRQEVERLLEGLEPEVPGAIGPWVDGLFASAPSSVDTASDDEELESLLGPDIARSLELVPRVLGLLDAVIDPDAIPDVGGVAQAAAERWASNWADISRSVHAAGEGADMIGRVANANLMLDLGDELEEIAAGASITREQLIDRLCADDDPIARMPFYAVLRQLTYHRLRDPGQGWVANDLVDMNFLGGAASYCDVVVGERQATGYLRQARSPRPRARLARTLAEAAEHVRALRA